MKRDMDLVRKILFTLEEHPSRSPVSILSLPGYSSDLIRYHTDLMLEAGLIQLLEREFRTDEDGIGLTWTGHEFLDNARDDSRWKKLRKLIGDKAGGASFAVISSTLTWLTEEAIKGTIKIP